MGPHLGHTLKPLEQRSTIVMRGLRTILNPILPTLILAEFKGCPLLFSNGLQEVQWAV